MTNSPRKKLALSLFGTSVITLSSALAQLIMAVLLARVLQPENYGKFTFALGATIILAQFSGLGWPMLSNLLLPKFLALKEWGNLKGFFRAADIVVLITSFTVTLVIVALVFVVTLPVDMFLGLLLAAGLLVPMSFRLLRRQQLVGMKRPALGIFLDVAPAPLFVIVALIFFQAVNVYILFGIYSLGSLISILLSTIILQNTKPYVLKNIDAVFQLKDWSLLAFPMLLAVGGNVILKRIDVVMLAPLSTMEQVGYYGTAMRITFAVGILSLISSAVFWPAISGAFSVNNFKLLRRLLKTYALILGGGTLLVSVILFLNADFVIRLVYGASFLDAVPIFQILVFSQILLSLNAISTGVLLMTDAQKIYGVVISFYVILNIILNLLFIPQGGALGAAYATLITSTGLLFTVTIIVFRKSALWKRSE